MNKIINVLSLFDGIATGLVSLKELEYTPNYFASEINEDSIKIAMKNHPEIIQLGDITKLSYKNGYLYINPNQEIFVDHIDLVIGGSPCNQLSIQHQTREGLKGKDSMLFYQYLRLLNEIKPKYFLLENVKMTKYNQDIITNLLGVNPIKINSSLVSAQKRDRLYWTNIPNIKLPEDKHILFKDIIENGFVDKEKSNCITESISRQVCTPGGIRRYMMGFGSIVFESQEEYERIVGKTSQDRSLYHKNIRKRKSSELIEHIDTPKGRLITPNEGEILQTLPKDYTYIENFYYSSRGYNQNRGDLKRLSVLGEGWTKDVISHILKNMEF